MSIRLLNRYSPWIGLCTPFRRKIRKYKETRCVDPGLFSFEGKTQSQRSMVYFATASWGMHPTE
jgi:hypothetical protein